MRKLFLFLGLALAIYGAEANAYEVVTKRYVIATVENHPEQRLNWVVDETSGQGYFEQCNGPHCYGLGYSNAMLPVEDLTKFFMKLSVRMQYIMERSYAESFLQPSVSTSTSLLHVLVDAGAGVLTPLAAYLILTGTTMYPVHTAAPAALSWALSYLIYKVEKRAAADLAQSAASLEQALSHNLATQAPVVLEREMYFRLLNAMSESL